MARSSGPTDNQSMERLITLFKGRLDQIPRQNWRNYEFEVRFGTELLPNTSMDFANTMDILKKYGFQVNDSNYSMKILCERNTTPRDYSFQDIRIELNNLVSIQKLCNDNELLMDENLKFVTKRNMQNIDINLPVYNKDFNFKTSINEEIEENESNQTVQYMISKNNWNTHKKLFRYIHRTSLIHPSMPNIRVDLSVVKHNNRNHQLRFSDIDILNSESKYEIEIELTNFSQMSNMKKTIGDMKKTIKYILCGIQKTKYPISYNEMHHVHREYYELFGKQISRDYEIKSNDFIGPSSVTLQKHNILKVEGIDSICIQDEFCVTDKADGERKLCFISSNGKVYLISSNMEVQYVDIKITDKRLFKTLMDGEYITKNRFGDKICLFAAFDLYFARGKDYRSLPFVMSEYEKMMADKEGKGKDTRYNSLNSRISAINKLVGTNSVMKFEIKSFSVSMTPNKELKDVDDEFLAKIKSMPIISIFDCCDAVLQKQRNDAYQYNTDGLIFTSKSLGVGQNKVGETIANRKKTWNYSFKWKPSEYNTIDFLIEVKKNASGKLDIKSKRVNGVIQQYYVVYLKTGVNVSRHMNKQHVLLSEEYLDSQYYSRSGIYKPDYFNPTNPVDSNAHICHIPLRLNSSGQLAMYSEENDIIMDDTIVEFSYDKECEDRFMRWKPLRNRSDKTTQYRLTNDNFGNSFQVANNNWQSIHNPVSPLMLSIPNQINENEIISSDEDVYYNGNKSDGHTISLRDFHNKVVKSVLIDYCAKKFKRGDAALLDLAVGKGGDISKWISSKLKGVLGIDISKDNIINEKNGACQRYIEAYKRDSSIPICMFIQGNTGRLMSNGDFMNINPDGVQSSKKEVIVDEEEFNDDPFKTNRTSQEILKALMGSGKKDTQVTPFLKRHFGLFREKFDITSIQFAIHYMFKDVYTLHSFIRNVAEYTKTGGYFIGTCFDGKKIYNELKVHGGEDGIIQKYAGNDLIWHIRREYEIYEAESVNENDETTTNDVFFHDDESSLGFGVSVYQESINKEFTEYLVNFDYFVKVMNIYGFELDENIKIGSQSFKGYSSFKNIFNLINDTDENGLRHLYLGKSKEMSESEQYISFLNNFFVFRKVTEIPSIERTFEYYTASSDKKDRSSGIQQAEKTNMMIELK